MIIIIFFREYKVGGCHKIIVFIFLTPVLLLSMTEC